MYRFWINNHHDILGYDCGIMWLVSNTSLITAAPCVEQASRPYVCKQRKYYEIVKTIKENSVVLILLL